MWLNQLKIAIIEKNTVNLDKLLDNIPELTEIKEMQEALYLCREATELLYEMKDDSVVAMNQIKKNLEFLKATQVKATNKLDIKL